MPERTKLATTPAIHHALPALSRRGHACCALLERCVDRRGVWLARQRTPEGQGRFGPELERRKGNAAPVVSLGPGGCRRDGRVCLLKRCRHQSNGGIAGRKVGVQHVRLVRTRTKHALVEPHGPGEVIHAVQGVTLLAPGLHHAGRIAHPRGRSLCSELS